MRAFELIILAFAFLLFPVFSTQAQDKGAREREALVRAQKSIAKLQQENSAIGREKGELAAKLEKTNKDLEVVKSDAARNRQRVTAVEKDLSVLRDERNAIKEKLEVAEKQLTLMSGQLQEGQQNRERLEADRNTVLARLKQESQALNSCTAANDKLYLLSRDLLQNYEKSARDRADPVFGLRIVEIETQVQGYRDRADESRLPRMK